MNSNCVLYHFCALIILVNSINIVLGQTTVTTNINATALVWCTTSKPEQNKCESFAQAVVRDAVQFRNDFFNFTCKQAFDSDECMTWLDEEKAHLTTLDSGELFVAGRFHSLLPIMQEVYEGKFKYYYAVAVVKKKSTFTLNSLADLRDKKVCFPGVGTLAGWAIPINMLMKKGHMEIIDCNNHVKSAINFFGPSCAINSLIDKYNPIGDNSDKLCALCTGKLPGEKCNKGDLYAGYEGAFRCLLEAGDVAFLKHTTVAEMLIGDEFNSVTKDQFELFCEDGTRRSVDDYRSCNWGSAPANTIVTSSAKSFEERKKIQDFFEIATRLYGLKDTNTMFYNTSSYDSRSTTESYNPYGRSYDNNNNNNNFNTNNNFNNQDFNSNQNRSTDQPAFYEKFSLFLSAPRYGDKHNLMFQDTTVGLDPLPESQQGYAAYLGSSLKLILDIRKCTVNRMTLCVTSDPEMEKCIKMKIALEAQLLKPEMSCFKGQSHIHCMYAIQSGNADVAMLDASDIYTAGLHHDLVPFISEVYNLGTSEYYVVAVAKEEDDHTDLTYLKGKYTCHPGINMAAGWVYPLAYLISNGWIRSYGCNSLRAAAEYFTKSCVPGAISPEYNTDVQYDNMCDLCHGASYRYCRRDASEDYYGYTGALRCLIEGGGDVAFVKHTTVMENTDGKRREWWARNALTGDFELLCPDGTRAEVNAYMDCNLGKVKANALVTRGGYAYNETEINAFINLFIYAQQFYGRKDADEFSFSMFYSAPPYSDLIFQDAAQQLEIIPSAKRYYSSYLGNDYMRARRIVDCHASASTIQLSIVSVCVFCISMIFSSRNFI